MEIRHIKSKSGDKYALTLLRMRVGNSYSEEIEEYKNEDYWFLKVPTDYYNSFRSMEYRLSGFDKYGYICLISRVKRDKESKIDYQVSCPAKFGVILDKPITEEEIDRFFKHVSKLSFLFDTKLTNISSSIEFPLPISYTNNDDTDSLTEFIDQIEDEVEKTDEHDKNKVVDLTKFKEYPFITNEFILYNSTIKVDNSNNLNNTAIYAYNVNTVIDKSVVKDMILSLVGNDKALNNDTSEGDKLSIYKSSLTNSRLSCRSARLDITGESLPAIHELNLSERVYTRENPGISRFLAIKIYS